MADFSTTAAVQPESLQTWVEWATNYGINGGTCVNPHIRCKTNPAMCDGCEIFDWCTVKTKKKKK